jgi:hypothetical protein
MPSSLQDNTFFVELLQTSDEPGKEQMQTVASVRAQLKTIVSLQLNLGSEVAARRREVVYTWLDMSRMSVLEQDALVMRNAFLIFLKVSHSLDDKTTVRVWVNIGAQATEANYYKSVSGLAGQVFPHKESSFYLSALIMSTSKLSYVSWTLLADAAVTWKLKPIIVPSKMLEKDRVTDVSVDPSIRVSLFMFQPTVPVGAGRLFVQVMPARKQGRLGYNTWEQLQDSVYVVAMSTWEGSARYWQVCVCV